ncbi:MAG: hypothetical protein OXF05_00170 [Hyphomicrobiales bacterium]|nr:hypothetical protein [Hyphomicrobiales bacterium]
MAEQLKIISPLMRSNFSGTARSDAPGVHITDRRGLALVQIFARPGKEESLVRRLDLPMQPGRSRAHSGSPADYLALPLAPKQWMLVSEGGKDGSFSQTIREYIGEFGYVSEQSHSRAVLRIGGTHARELLSKGCRLDLHPRVMSAGACASTTIAHVGVLLHQVDDAPVYDLLVYSGFAQYFWEWLEESAAEFGLASEVEII